MGRTGSRNFHEPRELIAQLPIHINRTKKGETKQKRVEKFIGMFASKEKSFSSKPYRTICSEILNS